MSLDGDGRPAKRPRTTTTHDNSAQQSCVQQQVKLKPLCCRMLQQKNVDLEKKVDGMLVAPCTQGC